MLLYVCLLSMQITSFCHVYYLGDQIEENGLGGDFSTRGEMTAGKTNLVGNPENRRFCRRRYKRIEFSCRCNGYVRLGASLPEDGGRTGFRNVVF
jgi:hypothetical protein